MHMHIIRLVTVCHHILHFCSTYWQAGPHALHIAANDGNIEIAEALLRAGLTIDEVVY